MGKNIYIERSGAAVKKLRRDVFLPAPEDLGSCYSLTGPNSTGKTTLIRHLMGELAQAALPNVYCFYRNIETGYTFWSFWASLILEFSKALREEQLRAAPTPDGYIVEELLETYDFFRTRSPETDFGNATNYLNNLFDNYTRLGIHIILVLDEFDRAAEVFRDTQFYDRLFSLSPKSGSELKLSIVTVSRRSYGTIAVYDPEGSDPSEAFPQLALRGFSNRELEDYFATYADLPWNEDRRLPSQQERQAILYFGGRSPAVLMNLREALADAGSFDLNDVEDLHGTYTTVYNRLCRLLSTEFVDSTRQVSCMTPFLEWFIGPRHSVQLPDYMQHLVRHGYVNKAKLMDSLYVLSGMEEPGSQPEKEVYESVSPYFERYLVNYYRRGDLRYCSNLLEDTERLIRQIIAESLQQAYGDNWKNELQLIAAQEDQKTSFLSSLVSLAEETDFPRDSLSKLNVMSWPNYAKVILDHWSLFEQRFSPRTQNQLSDSFSFLKSCRDCSGHHNMEVLNESMRERLKRECAYLLKRCDPNWTPLSGLTNEAEGEQPASQPAAQEAEPVPTAEAPLLGSAVDLVETNRGPRGNLRGFIRETDIRVSVPKIRLDAAGISAAQLAGKDVRVRLVSWDRNANAYLGDVV